MKEKKKSLFPWLTGFFQSKFDTGSWVVFMAVIIGAITAFAGHLLHVLVGSFNKTAHAIADFGGNARSTLIFLLPLLGITLSFMVQKFFGGRHFAKSLAPLILSLARRKNNFPLSETVTHLLSSALSVGFGGSAGLEAPSVLAGAAIGSNVGRVFRAGRVPRGILVGCGAAAAISAIFDSPIGGVLFVVEALLPEFSLTALVPLVLASAVSSLISQELGDSSAYFMSGLTQWNRGEIPHMFLCGICCALVGAFVIRSIVFSSRQLERFCPGAAKRLIFGGLLVCLILFVFPSLRGQGYLEIEQLLLNDTEGIRNAPELLSWCGPVLLPVLILAASIFIKPVVSSLTVESGGDGGIFAPTLFIGAFTGFAFARIINTTGLASVSESNFAAFGMCGVFTAVMRAPLTGVFLIAETTAGYSLLPPLMIVSSIAWITGKLFEPQSIYRKSLVDKHLLSEDKNLERIHFFTVKSCMRTMTSVLRPEMTLREAAEVLEHGKIKGTIFPVVNGDGHVLGMIQVENLLSALLEPRRKRDARISTLMKSPRAVIHENESLDVALLNMEACRVHYLPVVSSENEKCLGILLKNDVFGKYRKER